MRFKVKEDFKHGHSAFEEGNTYDSEKQGLSDAEIKMFHKAGWVSIDGQEDNKRNPSKSVLLETSSISQTLKVKGV